ncbi:MAG: winged helix-turn-helix transcriptional regulator [Candidatus Diapherotrites archaeon]|uniref:Winged helix-turn-helix transcriptional regulator n=1 Tax=Candidatus Iainarchaeum sp. TaxID=3101447 RepID=A0A8T4CBV2_9ARCH|nr:winged helix-turn-helix transcriptional regulator [Candidatus Diapherotrites archaeon]
MADDEGFAKALQLDVRKRIYTEVEQSPGLHFREIQRRTNLAVGSLQYHLDYLQKHHIIRTQNEGKFVRYYSVRGPQVGDAYNPNMGQNIMASLRHESTRKIILFLLNENRANNERIAEEINLSPSTTSWHLDKLVESGVLKKERAGRKSFFTLNNPSEARKLLINFKQSFFDQAVDNFVELTQTLTTDSSTPENESNTPH